MKGNTLNNVSNPVNPQDIATKEYTDKRHIIAVHAHYKGELRKDQYQFTFGGNVASGIDTGFLVPQSGRIKK